MCFLPRTATCPSVPAASAGRSSSVLAIGSATDAAAAATWRCAIKLRLERDRDGVQLPVAQEKEFCTVYNKAHIEPCVKAAQAVLLNPQRAGDAVNEYAPRSGVHGDDCDGNAQPDKTAGASGDDELVHSAKYLELVEGGREHDLDFTYNSVLLEIDGAEVDLTIIDLPGESHACSV